MEEYDIAIIGGGISGFSAALRLQTKGHKTVVFEAHGQIGGCAGFFTKKHFSFDVGATTLVDFSKEGIGGKFFKDINLQLIDGEYIDYIAWLPDRKVTLFRDPEKWKVERLEKLGATENHVRFWKLMDRVTEIFWNASRQNLKLPIRSFSDLSNSIRSIGIKNLHYVRYLNLTMLDVLKKFHLENEKALKGLLSMLIEDTVHSTLDKAPFLNAALGTTIRGAGLMRATGGMQQFWHQLSHHYYSVGGVTKRGNKVTSLLQEKNDWIIHTTKDIFKAKKIISSLPIDLTYAISPLNVKRKIQPYLTKNKTNTGSAIVVFLGVPEDEVLNQSLTHHQLLQNYEQKLRNGNNMFISVSAKNDILSAPEGFRSVMISTHCEIAEWKDLSNEEYELKKEQTGNYLIECARKVYPELAKNCVIKQVGTPHTYQKFTHRTNGAVGGFKQNLYNSNFKSVPQTIGLKNFWITGDTTWPGLGTVAGLISGRIAAEYAN